MAFARLGKMKDRVDAVMFEMIDRLGPDRGRRFCRQVVVNDDDGDVLRLV